jgi:hypothetical protein
MNNRFKINDKSNFENTLKDLCLKNNIEPYRQLTYHSLGDGYFIAELSNQFMERLISADPTAIDTLKSV